MEAPKGEERIKRWGCFVEMSRRSGFLRPPAAAAGEVNCSPLRPTHRERKVKKEGGEGNIPVIHCFVEWVEVSGLPSSSCRSRRRGEPACRRFPSLPSGRRSTTHGRTPRWCHHGRRACTCVVRRGCAVGHGCRGRGRGAIGLRKGLSFLYPHAKLLVELEGIFLAQFCLRSRFFPKSKTGQNSSLKSC